MKKYLQFDWLRQSAYLRYFFIIALLILEESYTFDICLLLNRML